MILILGANGQVGGALARRLAGRCMALTRAQADLALPERLAAALERFRPTAVINAAAYTQVDKAEGEPELAFAVNAHSPGIVAKWCQTRDIPLVHYSTDYVFSGGGDAPWTEDDETHPLNVYGRSKKAGEEAVAEAGGRHLIFRTSWVYDEAGKNFFNTMLRLGHEREALRVVADQHGAPTYAGHLAEATLKALENAIAAAGFPTGIYHLCHGGETTWHGFAEAIFHQSRGAGSALKVRQVEPIATADYPTPAPRPRNSRLSCEKIRRALGVELPAWQEGLKACITGRYADPRHPFA